MATKKLMPHSQEDVDDMTRKLDRCVAIVKQARLDIQRAERDFLEIQGKLKATEQLPRRLWWTLDELTMRE